MLSPTEQYREQNIVISTGYEPDLSRVPVPDYSDEQHETWAIMYDRQMKSLPNAASKEYLDALATIDLPSKKIPRLADVSKKLESATGWRIARVEGLVPEKEFFECLSQKLFPCTDFIRERNELEYTPSPDMFHDLFGHCPLITNKSFAEFYEYFGKAALKASAEQIIQLQRIYWFTVEFGLINNTDGIRIYGSGILSSVGEVAYSLGPQPRRHLFNYDVVTKQTYEIFHMQEDLFIIPDFEWLLTSFKSWVKKEGLDPCS